MFLLEPSFSDLSGDERGETSAVRRLKIKGLDQRKVLKSDPWLCLSQIALCALKHGLRGVSLFLQI